MKCPNCGVDLEVRRSPNNPRKFDHGQALALLKFGATPREVAEAFGVSRQRIYEIKRRAGEQR